MEIYMLLTRRDWIQPEETGTGRYIGQASECTFSARGHPYLFYE